MSIREGSDAGAPPVKSHPDGPEAQAYSAIARNLLAQYPDLRR
jgi:ATP-binding protein involved in chromosome partitioning